jgi:hypothetical protein
LVFGRTLEIYIYIACSPMGHAHTYDSSDGLIEDLKTDLNHTPFGKALDPIHGEDFFFISFLNIQWALLAVVG